MAILVPVNRRGILTSLLYFLSRTIQFIINIKLHIPDVFKQSIPRRAQYNINIHAQKRIGYLPL